MRQTISVSGMKVIHEMPSAAELIDRYPLTDKEQELKQYRDNTVKSIIAGHDKRMLLVIGPCSADREDAVLEYMIRLRKLQDEVSDKIFIIPRLYSNKPRTLGIGYKGMLHQPDPDQKPDIVKGISSVREMNIRVIRNTGFTCADELLYPDNYQYLHDLLSYVAIGARSVEDQQHRMIASGVSVPVGMKNPTSGNLTVMINSIIAAQASQNFIYAGMEVKSNGNQLAHAILRGYDGKDGMSRPNYHYEDLTYLYSLFLEHNIGAPSVIVDCNHCNSNKRYLSQIWIAKDVLHSRTLSTDIHRFMKGLMIESYLEDGAQKVGENVYGKSITDPCLGWEKTEKLVNELAELW